MIKNQREHRITEAQVARFERALAVPSGGGDTGIHPLVRKAQEAALASQLLELQEQIAEYEALQATAPAG